MPRTFPKDAKRLLGVPPAADPTRPAKRLYVLRNAAEPLCGLLHTKRSVGRGRAPRSRSNSGPKPTCCSNITLHSSNVGPCVPVPRSPMLDR